MVDGSARVRGGSADARQGIWRCRGAADADGSRRVLGAICACGAVWGVGCAAPGRRRQGDMISMPMRRCCAALLRARGSCACNCEASCVPGAAARAGVVVVVRSPRGGGGARTRCPCANFRRPDGCVSPMCRRLVGSAKDRAGLGLGACDSDGLQPAIEMVSCHTCSHINSIVPKARHDPLMHPWPCGRVNICVRACPLMSS